MLCINGFDLDVNFLMFCYKMGLTSTSLETIKLEDQTNYSLTEIGRVKDYFNTEIQYPQSLTNKMSKYLTALHYTNKILTVFLTVFSGTNIFIHVKNKKVVSLITFVFSLTSVLSLGIIIRLKEETKLRKKKHNRLLYLAKNKLDCVEMLISNSIKDGVIDHDEFLEIIKEKNSMIVKKMKTKLRLFKKESFLIFSFVHCKHGFYY